MTKGNDGVYTAQIINLDPGKKYGYKFIVNVSDWITDPANPNQDNGNSVFAIPGLAGYMGETPLYGQTIYRRSRKNHHCCQYTAEYRLETSFSFHTLIPPFKN